MTIETKAQHCRNCRFSVLDYPAGSITGQRYCRHSPPAMMMHATPQGLTPGIGFPPVKEDFWCFQFAEKEPQIQAANEGTIALLETAQKDH